MFLIKFCDKKLRFNVLNMDTTKKYKYFLALRTYSVSFNYTGYITFMVYLMLDNTHMEGMERLISIFNCVDVTSFV
jgi:hypothetical protein